MFLKTYRAGVRSFDNYSEFSLSIVHIRHFFLIYQNPDIFFFFLGGGGKMVAKITCSEKTLAHNPAL